MDIDRNVCSAIYVEIISGGNGHGRFTRFQHLSVDSRGGLAEGMAKGAAKGAAEGVRFTLLQIGARRFGSPAVTVQEALDAVDDVARLRRMAERVLDVASWQELLDTP